MQFQPQENPIMLYLGIDLHAKQFTVNVRNESGDVVLRRQVSTAGDRPAVFLAEVTRLAGTDGYVAMLEICGFHDWLTELLPHCGCREVILVQAEQRDRRKTDRRDAASLSETLWINRHRLLAGLPVRGVRRITPATESERHDRRLTQLRRKSGAERTRVLNAVQQILRRLNIAQFMPVKGIQTGKAQTWLRALSLPTWDRFEMNQLLDRWEWLERELRQLEIQIRERVENSIQAMRLRTVPGIGPFVALAISSRIGNVKRFRAPRSLANYFGLTPRCRNSGESAQRLGSITKQGSVLVRFLLGQLVMHVLRRDPTIRAWYQRIKRRRGSKIARVAVMRRMTVIMWHMLTREQSYVVAAAPNVKPSPRRSRKALNAPTVPAGPLGALPPDPRDLTLSAPSEGGTKAATRTRKKTSGRSKPSALRSEAGTGARGASQQGPILPSG
jgi:transposase